MIEIEKVKKQITDITLLLTRNSLLHLNNFPIRNGNEIVWNDYTKISYLLNRDNYSNVYNNIVEKGDFNFIFLDGSIIQMMYRFDDTGREIKAHRLAFYPNISNDQFGEEPEEYEENIYGLRSFSDLSYSENITTPLRFDYDDDDEKFIEKYHSYSHLSIGGYKNCRISVKYPLTPYRFIKFILKSFYYEKSLELDLLSKLEGGFCFIDTLKTSEEEDGYLKL